MRRQHQLTTAGQRREHVGGTLKTRWRPISVDHNPTGFLDHLANEVAAAGVAAEPGSDDYGVCPAEELAP